MAPLEDDDVTRMVIRSHLEGSPVKSTFRNLLYKKKKKVFNQLKLHRRKLRRQNYLVLVSASATESINWSCISETTEIHTEGGSIALIISVFTP